MYFHAFLSLNTKENRLTRRHIPSGNEQNTENTSRAGSSSEEFVAVHDDNICTAPKMAEKDILEFVQSSKNMIDANSEDENEMNNNSFSHILQNEESHQEYAQLFRRTLHL
ncbi:hypothetical protein TNCV_1849021 [Trichonephila clavipes]|nr:hypothetical protein TNCV_1849021 [Trichonephila clavipes]